MRFLFKLILLLVFSVPLAVAGALYLAIDLEPAVRRAAEITPANIKRAKRILDQNIPRGARTGASQSVTISQQDLDLAANYLAHFYANGSARLDLKNDKVELTASLRPPMAPMIFYFNVNAVLTGGSPMPRFEQLRVGRLPIPGFIADWLSMRVMTQFFGKDALDVALQTIKQINLTKGQLVIAYEWQSNLREKLRSAIVSPDEQARLRAYQEHLTLISNSPMTKNVSLSEFLVALFELAEVRSRPGSPVAENRAAILVLAFYVNGKSLGTILSAANEWPRPMEHRVTLNGRDDFAKHFIISAALAANAGGPLADAVGVYKEIDDSRGGSGFSFNDIAADRAGTRFGEKAAGSATSARKLQARLAAGIAERDIMPVTSDLPEFMAEAEFKRRFGGVDAPAYKQMMADIERRIAALKLYR
jgi:hypothetical protein